MLYQIGTGIFDQKEISTCPYLHYDILIHIMSAWKLVYSTWTVILRGIVPPFQLQSHGSYCWSYRVISSFYPRIHPQYIRYIPLYTPKMVYILSNYIRYIPLYTPKMVVFMHFHVHFSWQNHPKGRRLLIKTIPTFVDSPSSVVVGV